MNPVKIQQTASAPAFDEGKSFAIPQAFGGEEATLRRLQRGKLNDADRGGVLENDTICQLDGARLRIAKGSIAGCRCEREQAALAL